MIPLIKNLKKKKKKKKSRKLHVICKPCMIIQIIILNLPKTVTDFKVSVDFFYKGHDKKILKLNTQGFEDNLSTAVIVLGNFYCCT